MVKVKVESANCKYTDEYIESSYVYDRVDVERPEGAEGPVVLKPVAQKYTFRTERKVPKLGMMIVGWGGNNGSTVTAGIIANREKLTWRSKEGVQHANFYGSLSQASSVRLGNHGADEVFVLMKDLLPMADPCELAIAGWDISKFDLGKGMERAGVLEINLQDKLRPFMDRLQPLPSVYYPDFIAANQEDRADNVIPGSDKWAHVEHLRKDMREFKEKNKLDKVVVVWSANTERFAEIKAGVNDSWANLEKSIKESHSEVSQSTVFAVAAILEGCIYINGSPQNTFVPGLIDLAARKNALIAGDDFKSGQTKFKSVLVDFLVSAGIKTTCIVSYNHLGNNDGKNLSAPKQFRSKEISKSSVVDDVVASNTELYHPGEKPDHCVVIKYVPYVGDSKRALDEYTSEIFLGGKNTIVVHNTCEDSLLAAPLIVDLVVLGELMSRITYKAEGMTEFKKFHPVLSVLGYLLKAPLAPEGTPVINALFRQRSCIENILRACIGLPPDNNMLLEHKFFDAKQK